MKEKKTDKWDYICASASGSLTALLDIFFIEDISLANAHSWGKEKTDAFVMSTAKSEGYKGKDLAGAIKHLEDKYPIYADDATNDFGGGNFHHLRDFSHHPTLTGLKYSIQTQFTGKAYGTDTTGKFIEVDIDGWEQHDFFHCVRTGTFDWIMHMISDMAGSSGSVQMGKEGTGLPGPLLSFLKELSAKPTIEKLVKQNDKGNDKFSVICQKLFDGTLLGEHDEKGKIIKGKEVKFDFRTELGLPNEILGKKQYLPVLINLAIISVLFFVRGFIEEIQNKDITGIADVRRVDIGNLFDWKNPRLRHMIILSQAIFSLIDISESGIKAAIRNKNDRSGFIRDFIQGINYCGLGALAISLTGEAGIKLYDTFKHYTSLVKEKFPQLADGNSDYKEIKDAAWKTVNTVVSIGKIGTPIGFVFAAIGVYKEISLAVKERNMAKEARIQAEEYCRRNIAILEAERETMEQIVTDYMEKKLVTFSAAFNTMDAAVENNDANDFIKGNRILQKELGRQSFENTDEFNAIMSDRDVFKL